jgi:hypothetical protein
MKADEAAASNDYPDQQRLSIRAKLQLLPIFVGT